MKGQDHECNIRECLNHARSIIKGVKWCDTCLQAYYYGRREMFVQLIDTQHKEEK